MPVPQGAPVPWNAEAHIACAFSFQCPQVWDRLQCTGDPLVRHCLICDKAVHLAITEEDFEKYRGKGICVAVPIIHHQNENQTLFLGSLEDTSYNSDIDEVE
jgi:hypothetical protein